MEKVLSVEERIRRAEEIYARRRGDNTSTSISDARVPIGEKRKASPLKKMLIQICICALIYAIFYIIQNGDYIFTPKLTEQIKQVLEYDMNIQKMGEDVLSYINKERNKNVIIPEENQAPTNNEQQSIEEVPIEPEIQSNENPQEELPSEILAVTDEPVYTEEASSISQTQMDADYIKQNYSLIKPLEGTITSRFGNRNPTTETVPKYHTGIDIAREVGAKIIASMEGEVTLVSSSGDYRKAFKNSERRGNYIICAL